MFSADIYNHLPSIKDATDTFNDKLKSSGITLDVLLADLQPLFCEERNRGKYAIWLIHHHVALNEGERMVKKGAITEPTTDTSPYIVAERWNDQGDELEHVSVSDLENMPLPPSADFLARFRGIMDARKIDGLGICSDLTEEEQAKAAEGFVFLETTDTLTRRHIVTAIPNDDPSLKLGLTYKSGWTIVGKGEWNCGHLCTPGQCTKPPPSSESPELAKGSC